MSGAYAMEKMKAKDEEYRLERMQTKQKDGTPTVVSILTSLLFYCQVFQLSHILLIFIFIEKLYIQLLQRDIDLQQLVFHWLMHILDDMPQGKQDYDQWIQDGKVITKGSQNNKLSELN